ncbi:hypothetical protein Dimus_036660, partial [Dionaea muscipula]
YCSRAHIMAMVMMTAASLGARTAAHGGVSSDSGRDGARRITTIGMGCGAARRETITAAWRLPRLRERQRGRASAGLRDARTAACGEARRVRAATARGRRAAGLLREWLPDSGERVRGFSQRARGARTALRRARAVMRSVFFLRGCCTCSGQRCEENGCSRSSSSRRRCSANDSDEFGDAAAESATSDGASRRRCGSSPSMTHDSGSRVDARRQRAASVRV